MLVGGPSTVAAFQGSASGTPPDRGAAGAPGDVAGTYSSQPASLLPALKAAIIDANRALSAMNRAIQFVLDPASGKLVAQLVDTSDNEVLRQIPSEEMLRIAQALDHVQGLLIEQRV